MIWIVTVTESTSRNIDAASPKDTPCLSKFAVALFLSHVNVIVLRSFLPEDVWQRNQQENEVVQHLTVCEYVTFVLHLMQEFGLHSWVPQPPNWLGTLASYVANKRWYRTHQADGRDRGNYDSRIQFNPDRCHFPGSTCLLLHSLDIPLEGLRPSILTHMQPFQRETRLLAH